MSSEDHDRATVEALNRIASELHLLNQQLDRVIRVRRQPGAAGPGAEYHVVVVETRSIDGR